MVFDEQVVVVITRSMVFIFSLLGAVLLSFFVKVKPETQAFP